MTNKRHLEFCFKEGRHYVQGPDIYNKVLALLEADMRGDDFDLSCHGLLSDDVYLSEEKPPDKETLKFIVKYIGKDAFPRVLFGVAGGTPIKCEIAYDEEEIRCRLTLHLAAQEVTLAEPTPYTFIENAVAMNKYLLQNLFPAAVGKWLFVRVHIKKMPAASYPLRLILRENFNFKLTKTEMTINGEHIGFLYFSLA